MNDGDEDDLVGTVLHGKWTLEKQLGCGGMATVYAARHKIGRWAAVKLLHPEIAVDDQVRARFEQEALAVNSIGHPGVVEILDVEVTDDGTHFLVMELLQGETLADLYEREGGVRLERLLDLTDQLLDVLVACHNKGIIHRDVKPENLFLEQNGKLKVLDFGIARVRDGLRTQAGTMLGTVAFSPPEQLKGAKVDHRADLFSVGATLFTILAGRRIHEMNERSSLTVKMLTTAAPPLAQVAPDIPEEVCLVVDRALAFLPDRRYPDARTMRGDVWAIQKGQRPPYAYACQEAGLSPHVTKLDDPPIPAAKAAHVPSTAEQLPVLSDDQPPPEPGALPSTQPQMPAFIAPEDEATPNGPEPSPVPPQSIHTEPTRQEGSQPPPDDDDDKTLIGGFERNRKWRTDPHWPVPEEGDSRAPASSVPPKSDASSGAESETHPSSQGVPSDRKTSDDD